MKAENVAKELLENLAKPASRIKALASRLEKIDEAMGHVRALASSLEKIDEAISFVSEARAEGPVDVDVRLSRTGVLSGLNKNLITTQCRVGADSAHHIVQALVCEREVEARRLEQALADLREVANAQ